MVLDNKKIVLTFYLLFFFIGVSYAQEGTKRYLIYLKDKKNTLYSIDKPEAFLTERAILRRSRQGIKITDNDLPVNPEYIQKIKSNGAKVWYSSRWMNALSVEADSQALASIMTLEFVKPEIELLYPKVTKIREAKPSKAPALNAQSPKSLAIDSVADYGKAYNQAQMIGADAMHQAGYRGKGMVIAVFDAGFLNADQLSFFTHLFESGRILGTYNFVDNHEYVYGTGDHGTKVLSTIAAYKKGSMIGTAPEASFYLFRTEDSDTEYKIEEINWLIAAEKADSLGVDVINSSLGYTTFDDKKMDYTYQSLDGNTALITRAADFAAQKGILVVNSAGNEGGGGWQYIGTPADADSILSIGAVNSAGKYAYFSSTGYTPDGRIKPNIVAQGASTVVGDPFDRITYSNGTSFSSPVMSGLVAGFWQANPQLTNMEVIKYLQASGSQAEKPDSLLGYGIPDFKKAHELAQVAKKKKEKGFMIQPSNNPTQLKIWLGENYRNTKLRLTLLAETGKVIQKSKINSKQEEYIWSMDDDLNDGNYTLKITGKGLEPVEAEISR
jgi:subtilisin family serine protease